VEAILRVKVKTCSLISASAHGQFLHLTDEACKRALGSSSDHGAIVGSIQGAHCAPFASVRIGISTQKSNFVQFWQFSNSSAERTNNFSPSLLVPPFAVI
jgi:hypothetical protein